MIPSDRDPSTFWITHPNATITNNVAGGSEGKGFWFLQASKPTGLSKVFQDSNKRHYFDKDELFHTLHGNISHNSVHSSSFGYFLDKILRPDQGVGGSIAHDPWADPKDKKSEKLTTYFTDINCYKIARTCIWMKIKRGEYSSLKVAEAGELMFTRDSSRISNSLFVGFSDRNFGVPNR